MKGLYVHLPFCRRRCSYCPFAISVDIRLRERYFIALDSELQASWDGSAPATLYLGGGTPSLAERSELEMILGHLSVPMADEFTFEANPEDIDSGAIAMWREIGVTRLSIGVQSLHDSELKPLGRLHGGKRALDSLEMSMNEGFRTNADLIIGLPGQTRQAFVESLEPVLASGVGHLSLYVLDMDEDTPLRRRVQKGRATLPNDDLVSDLYMEAVDRCAAHGLEQYEISNFARPGEESRHNIGYWSLVPYVGVGLGAHSFDGTRRWANVKQIEAYLERSERDESLVDFEELLTEAERTEEEIFLSLRRREGIGLARLQAMRGEQATEWIDHGLKAGVLEVRDDRVSFTPRGYLLSNELIADLF